MRNFKVFSACILLALTAISAKADNVIYKDASQPIEKRVEDLVARMTLEEKVLQLNQYTLGRNDNVNNVAEILKKLPAELGSVIYFNSDPDLRNQVQRQAMEKSRLGIPMIFGYDVIHGYRTVYPISLAQACSWNSGLVEQACAVAAQEARMSGVDWTFSPMVDVARDGRWGRVSEGYGEDPYANAVFGVASIKGYQGNDMSDSQRVAACLKHYVGYGASEGGRDYVYTEISPQTLWDTYMLPYEEGVKAGAATLMSCFNDISGTPGTANSYILREILKNRWKHDGFVVSDWGAIQQLRSQGVAKDLKEAGLKAFTAGVEMDMMNNSYDKHLVDLVNEGKVPMAMVDDAVKRVLRVKFRLGLFEKPYTSTTTEKERFLLPANLKIAQQLAEESIVLLKNDNNILPLTKQSNVAVIGPMAKDKLNLLGSWSAHGKQDDVTSIYDGLVAELGKKVKLSYAEGCEFDGDNTSKFAEAVSVANKSEVIILCLGEKKGWSGENASRSTLALPKIQEDLVLELKKTGKPIVLLLSSGRPLELNRLEKLSDAMLEIWQPGIMSGQAVAGILSGRVNPSGKLSITFPYSTGQIPIYYNMRQSGRTHQGKYQDIPTTPLYEFTHGLSYTNYEYGDIKASATKIKRGDKLSLDITVSNSGKMDGKETVHWFIYDPVSTISRPVKELKHFEKQLIKAGESKTFRFEVDLERDFGFVDGTGKRFLESGDYYVIVKDKKIKIELD
ncbi:glycoside hydrolase family 3 N-terminal domain-containing protein [Dysgonomonas sp. 520]|uniref:glycoside hydrolase family 3 N-terminal domain-containing protein n=1 Tax=Dysgonomonas sp. 520 TaxID=2302931 RepID=UPI0013CFCA5D|nr:glycoside hydrolase family 3 N-terminal domain-containing protein [Dysgonomonas sp. 520]NDW10718.1 beta-glucosidase [Dysgonomonas sp. 520]